MSIELAVQLWKETKGFIHELNDQKEAAEATATVLMEHFDVEEIADAFNFDKNIIDSIVEYLDNDDLSDDEYYNEDY